MTTPSLRVVEVNARYYFRTWRGSVFSTFVSPLFTLLALGVGLGTLVDRQGAPGGVSYLAFLAPALMAASAMQTAAADSSYPVMAGIRWTKSYHAALATPITVAELVYGHFGWMAIRLMFSLVVYAAVVVLLGAASPPAAALAVLPAVLTGLAFGAPITAWVATLEEETGISSLFRFGIVPLFLFSGTFFPITQLPTWLQPLAFITPLWHGVELARGAAAVPGSPHFPWWVHTAVLSGFVVVGAVLSVRNLGRRMRK
jgi:lipooligosaccharide transport system permease protein